MLSFALLGFFILAIVFILIHEIKKSYNTESWRKPHSSARTRQYIRKKITIDNKHCSNLPGFDSRGIYSGVSGSFTDKTGKFNDAYQKDIDELNKEFGISIKDE